MKKKKKEKRSKLKRRKREPKHTLKHQPILLKMREQVFFRLLRINCNYNIKTIILQVARAILFNTKIIYIILNVIF